MIENKYICSFSYEQKADGKESGRISNRMITYEQLAKILEILAPPKPKGD